MTPAIRLPLRVVAVMLGLVLGLEAALAETYHSDTWGYSLELPPDWVQIPDSVLQLWTEMLLSDSAAGRIAYDVAFQPESARDWFAYPYVLVRVVTYASLGLADQLHEDDFPRCVRGITETDYAKAAEETLSEQTLSALRELAASEAHLDRERRRYWYSTFFTIEGVGEVKELCVGYFGREAIVQVAFYARRDEWERCAAHRLSILDSFRFDPDKACSEAYAAAHPGWAHRSPALRSILIATAFGACICVAYGVKRIFRRRRSQ